MKKKDTFVAELSEIVSRRLCLYPHMQPWRGARVAEEARLESVYTPKAYRGFESRSLRVVRLIQSTCEKY